MCHRHPARRARNRIAYMIQQNRIRKTIKWSGAVATLVIIGTWIGSMRLSVRPMFHGWFLGVNTGRVDFGWHRSPIHSTQIPDFYNYHPRWELALGSEFSLSGPVFYYVVVPLWFPSVCLILLTAFIWRRDALIRGWALAGACRRCHYDRTGLAAIAACPECGCVSPSVPEMSPCQLPHPAPKTGIMAPANTDNAARPPSVQL